MFNYIYNNNYLIFKNKKNYIYIFKTKNLVFIDKKTLKSIFVIVCIFHIKTICSIFNFKN